MSLGQRILVIVCALAIVSSYQFGRHVMHGELAEAMRDSLQEQLEMRLKAQQTADALTAENAKLRAEQAPKEKLITKEVTRYVQVTAPADRCTLPGTWRVRHDAAATGLPITPESGSVALGSAGPVEDAAALETVADNYAIARECAAKLTGWQQRYRQLERPEQ